jgi:salicylate hydroxylase
MAGRSVVIVGGGIGGLAAAVALRSRGAQVQLYEQAHHFGEVGAGLILRANSLRVLQRVSLGDDVARLGASITDVQYCQADGTVLVQETFGRTAEDTMLGLHRADLVTALAAHLPEEVVHTGHQCVAFAQDAQRAMVTFTSGAQAEAEVVVGADGIHSTLQHDVVAPSEPVFSGTVAYRGLIPAAQVPEWPAGSFRIWLGAGKLLLVYPVRAGELLNFVGAVPADEQMRESWSAPGDPAQLEAAFADGWEPLVSRILAQVKTTFRWGLYDRDPLPHWSRGRLTLLGDAAHPMLPYEGQGANQAIEDGMALATLLQVASAADVADALVRYEVLRHERAAALQQGSRANAALMGVVPPSLTTGVSWVLDYDVEAAASAVREHP